MRIRTIKPEFWTSETLAPLSDKAKLLAIALLNYADDEGFFWANPILIKSALFPFLDESKTIPRCVQELSGVGYIRLGKTPDGRSVGEVVNFKKHQRIDKPKPSIIGRFVTFQDESKTNPRNVQDASKEEQGTGNREQGGDGNGMDMGFSPPEEPEFVPTPNQIRFNEMFKRRNSTRWNKKEIEALKAIEPIDENDFAAVLKWYSAKLPPESDFRRRDLGTLLNNWNGEVDRARKFKPATCF